jgi:hypothetical protein
VAASVAAAAGRVAAVGVLGAGLHVAGDDHPDGLGPGGDPLVAGLIDVLVVAVLVRIVVLVAVGSAGGGGSTLVAGRDVVVGGGDRGGEFQALLVGREVFVDDLQVVQIVFVLAAGTRRGRMAAIVA